MVGISDNLVGPFLFLFVILSSLPVLFTSIWPEHEQGPCLSPKSCNLFLIIGYPLRYFQSNKFILNLILQIDISVFILIFS